MTTITRTTVRFSNARAGVSPATYGQRDMWDKLAVMEPHTHVLNILQVAHLPAGLALADVLGAIHDLVLRHEALRTRFRLDADGTLWQELTATGEIPVELGDGAQDEDPELASAAAEHELESTDFDLTRSWPVRLLAGTMGATPIVVMICTSHIAADMLSARLIRQDLIDLCDARIKGEPPPILPARRQPLDQAAFEASPACLRADQQARKSWRRRLESAPRSMFTAHPAAPRSPRFVRVTLSSAALPLAAEVLGARYRVTTAVIILAAQAVLLRHQADTDRCALNINVGNRIAPELAWSAGNIRQHSLAVLDLRGAGFGRIVQRAWSAWLLAQRAGIADPDGLRALRHGLELRRGLVFDISCGFNDLRFVTQPGPGAGAITPQHIAAAAQSTSCAWAEIPAHYGRFTMRVADEPGPRPPGRSSRVRVETCVDTAVLPPDQASALILGMERLLAWLAADEARGAMVLDGATLAEVTGVPVAVHPDGWVRVDGGWAEIAAMAGLLRGAAGSTCTAAQVQVQVPPGGDHEEPELVGYVAVRDPGSAPTPADLHARCIARLRSLLTREPRWLNAVAPHRYVICADVPGAAAGEAGWQARPVLAEGTGRPADDSPGTDGP